MHNKCPNCQLANFPAAVSCARCDEPLGKNIGLDREPRARTRGFWARALVCLCVCIAVLLGFYLSLVASARSLTVEQKSTVHRAINILRDRGFSNEAMLLDSLTVFRREDNWLNASVAKENAYAATNFPFEIVTLYPDFFTYPADDTERAAILLHEAKHLAGADEHDAYEFVWKQRKQLGWTKPAYRFSPVWENIRRQTKDNVPELFICDFNEFGDCTE